MSEKLSTMRIDVFRHPHTDGQSDRFVYADKGDINNPVSQEGVIQKNALAGFFPEYLRSENITQMPMVYIGNRVRVEEGWSAVRYGLESSNYFEGEIILRPEARFNEKFFGLTNFFQNLENPTSQEQAMADFLDKLSLRLYKQDPHRFAHLGGESHVSLYQRVVSGVRGALADARLAGRNHIIIPTSGGVMQCIQQRMGRSSSKGIVNPGNCDVHTYIGAADEWSMHKVYDGEKMMPVYEELKAEPLELPTPASRDKKAILGERESFQIPDDLREKFTTSIRECFGVHAGTSQSANDEANIINLTQAFLDSDGTQRQFQMLCTEVQRRLSL